MMNFNDFVQAYGGWIGFLLYFLYNQLWPFVTKKNINEREFQQKLELRKAEASETIALAMDKFAVGMNTTNERIAVIMTNQAMILQKQNETHDLLSSAIGDMKAVRGTDRRVGDKGD